MTASDVVREYVRAFDARDVERMVAVAHPEFEAVTPRGVIRGHDAIRGFMARQTYGVTPVTRFQRYFERGDFVVVFTRFSWRYADTREALEGQDEDAAVYTVRDGQVARFEPFGDLPSALESTGMTEDDEADARDN